MFNAVTHNFPAVPSVSEAKKHLDSLTERIREYALPIILTLGAVLLTYQYGWSLKDHVWNNPAGLVTVTLGTYVVSPFIVESCRVLFKSMSPWSHYCHRQGIDLFRKKKYGEANDYFAEAAQYGTNNADAHAFSGETSRRLSAATNAMNSFQVALAIRPSHPVARVGLAATHILRDDITEALANLQYFDGSTGEQPVADPSRKFYPALLSSAIALDRNPSGQDTNYPKSLELIESFIGVSPPADDTDLVPMHGKLFYALVMFFQVGDRQCLDDCLKGEFFNAEQKGVLNEVINEWFPDELRDDNQLSRRSNAALRDDNQLSRRNSMALRDDDQLSRRNSSTRSSPQRIEGELTIARDDQIELDHFEVPEPVSIAKVFANIHVVDKNFRDEFIYAFLRRSNFIRSCYRKAKKRYDAFRDEHQKVPNQANTPNDVIQLTAIVEILDKGLLYFPKSKKLLALKKRLTQILSRPTRPWSAICYDQGIELFLRQRYSQANDFFTQAIQTGSPNPDARAYSGEAARRLTDKTNAMKLFDQALSLSPSNRVARTGMAAVYILLGNLPDAAANLTYLHNSTEVTEEENPQNLHYSRLLQAAIAFDEDPIGERKVDHFDHVSELLDSLNASMDISSEQSPSEPYIRACHAFVHFFHCGDSTPMQDLLDSGVFDEKQTAVVQNILKFWFTSDESPEPAMIKVASASSYSEDVQKELDRAIQRVDIDKSHVYWKSRSDENPMPMPIAPIFANMHVTKNDFYHDFMVCLLNRTNIIKSHLVAARMLNAPSGGLSASGSPQEDDNHSPSEKKEKLAVRLEAALDLYNRALRFFPKSTKLLIEKASIFQTLGMKKFAIHALEKAIKVDEKNTDILYSLIECYESVTENQGVEARMRAMLTYLVLLSEAKPGDEDVKQKLIEHKKLMELNSYG